MKDKRFSARLYNLYCHFDYFLYKQPWPCSLNLKSTTHIHQFPKLIMRRDLTALKRAPSWLLTWAQGGLFTSQTCFGHVMAEMVSLRHLGTEARSPSRANASEFYGGQDSTRTNFFPVFLLFPATSIPQVFYILSFTTNKLSN